MGLSMSGNAMVFTSKDEMEEAFKIMEIDCDLSKVEDFGLVLSSMYAKAAEGVGVSVGDVLDPAFSGGVSSCAVSRTRNTLRRRWTSAPTWFSLRYSSPVSD